MINKEIYEGIKLALSRGYSLKDAMMSFYNAGYKKEDIEDSAREILKEQSTHESDIQKPVAKQELKKPENKKIPIPPKELPSKPKEKSKIKQNISSYEQEKPRGKWLVILLIIILLISIGILITTLFFKTEISDMLKYFLG
jgi:hypothetical protein